MIGYNRGVMRPVSRLIILLCLLISSSCSKTQSTVTVGIERTSASPTPPLPAPTAANTVAFPSPIVESPEKIATVTSPSILVSALATATSTASPTLSPDEWQNLPILPQPTDRIRGIYQLGLQLGNNPQAFSKIGDCGSTPAWFLGDFDRGPQYYELGDHQDLIPVIETFQGSFARTSLAAKSGFNASSVFSALWSDRDLCQPDETPLACEFRQQRPVIAFIMLGSNDVYHIDSFEDQMRKIIEFSLDNGIIPILSTKADNLEENHSINYTIARLSQEYQIPLINYWRAVQILPSKGLQEDDVHITWGPNRFDDKQVMRAGWPVRNLTSLQALDIVWRAATSHTP